MGILSPAALTGTDHRAAAEGTAAEFAIEVREAIRAAPIRAEYTGRGVTVAVIDDGFAQSHPDFTATYGYSLDWDWRDNDDDALNSSGERHGTAVTGIVGADDDGLDATGVAPGATIAGLRVGFGFSGGPTQYANALRDGARFDVVNASWGYVSRFADDFAKASFATSAAALDFGVREGRDELGTIYTFAAGNSRTSGDDVNHHNYQNAIETIAVASTGANGVVASSSTPGAAILV